MNPPVRVLVVDDEKPARVRLLELLKRHIDIEVTASVDCAEDALYVISSAATAGAPVDIVFVDVQMPEVDGFSMLDSLYALPVPSLPLIIFSTAYDTYAVRAFDAHAIDYLLKPYSDQRFETALSRAVRMVRAGQPGLLTEQLRGLLSALAPPPSRNYLDRLALKERGRVRLISVTDVRWISAAGVYVTINTVREAYLHRDVLGRLEGQLDPRQFIRVHRSHIVNFDFVKELVQDAHGELEVILDNAPPLKVSRMYRGRIEQRINQRL